MGEIGNFEEEKPLPGFAKIGKTFCYILTLFGTHPVLNFVKVHATELSKWSDGVGGGRWELGAQLLLLRPCLLE